MGSYALRAFTLLELMIAIGIGSLIIYTAVAGFRTASQTVTLSNRLSLENGMLRSGYFAAQNQLDFWTNLDDPTDPDRQKLRQTDDGPDEGRRLGLPFTPVRTIMPRISEPRFASGRPGPGLIHPAPKPTRTLVETWEQDEGWDPTYAWSVHDPRTWFRGNLADKTQEWLFRGRYKDPRPNEPERMADIWKMPIPPESYPQAIFGRYSMFSNIEKEPVFYAYTINTNPHPDPAVMDADDVKVRIDFSGTVTHTWYPRQVRDLMRAFGYAAMCEYLPPNAIYTYYKSTHRDMGFWGGGDTTAGGMFKLCVDPGYWHGNLANFCNGDGWQTTSRGIYRQTYSTSYAYINPDATNGSIGDLRWSHYRKYQSDYGATEGGGSDELKEMLRRSAFFQKALENRPDNWPELQIAVGRWIKNAHHVALAKVSMTSPLTGQMVELSWAGLGTTLRGARQQRSPTPDGGWAKWDNDGSASSVGANLDTP